MSETVIELKNVKKTFTMRGAGLMARKQSVKAVDDVTLDIGQGEIVGLIGESGSGKTTLARVMLGLTGASAGSIRFEGRALADMSRRELKALRGKIAVVFQDPMSNLNPRETVGSSIMRPLRIHGGSKKEAAERALETIRRVKLDEKYLQSYPHQLSGGQLQRIAIARALAMRPRLMILDEPTSALDISVQAQVLNILIDLQEENHLTYLIISHDINSIRYVSDRVAVMYLGQLVECGKAEDVLAHPQHPYTQSPLSSAPVMDPCARLRHTSRVLGETGSLTAAGNGCRFAPRCPHATDRCRSEKPPTTEVGPNHTCACFRTEAGME